MVGPKRTRGRRSNVFTRSALPPLYDAPRVIPAAKWKDLQSLFPLMPPDAKVFYKTLKPAVDNDDADSITGDALPMSDED